MRRAFLAPVPRLVSTPLVALFALSLGCAGTPKTQAAGAQAPSGTDEQIFIGDTIEKNYDPNVIMKRAEAFFEKEDYPEAIIEYQHFLDLHRVHTLASYAQYKLGESHFKLIKTVDRDPDPIYKALEAFEKLLKDYPGSRYESDALEKIRACHNLIAQANFFVGRFYYRQDAYLAAAHRFEAILKRYPDMEVAGDALYYLALTYKELGADDWAREKLVELVERYPNNQHQKESRRLLAQLNAKLPPSAVARAGVAQNGSLGNGTPNTTNGIQPQPATGPAAALRITPASITPVTAVRPPISPAVPGVPAPSNGVAPPAAAPSVETTVCRLGTWC